MVDVDAVEDVEYADDVDNIEEVTVNTNDSSSLMHLSIEDEFISLFQKSSLT